MKEDGWVLVPGMLKQFRCIQENGGRHMEEINVEEHEESSNFFLEDKRRWRIDVRLQPEENKEIT